MTPKKKGAVGFYYNYRVNSIVGLALCRFVTTLPSSSLELGFGL